MILFKFSSLRPSDSRYFGTRGAVGVLVIPEPDLSWLMTENEVSSLVGLDSVCVNRSPEARERDEAGLDV